MKHRLHSLNLLILFVFILLTANGFADLTITVEPDRRWGDAPTSNIKRLCENVAMHFQEHLRDEYKLSGQLTVVYYEYPVAFYKSFFDGGPDEYQVGLTVTDTYWSQFAYQFGHEFSHVLQDHDRITRNNPNSWFHESLCELATLWAISRMSETWEDRPPYRNWANYRHSLASYANNLKNRAEVQYSGTGAEWLTEWEDRMRSDESDVFLYSRVVQLSYKFLPIFEENPEAWNIIRQMPATRGKMSEYMQDWYDRVDTEDQPFVKAIATEMGISVDADILVINADVNRDGYVDLSDVLIVRSGMQNPNSYDTDINNDGTTDEIDLLIVKAKAFEAIAAAAPSKRKTRITTWGAMKKQF